MVFGKIRPGSTTGEPVRAKVPKLIQIRPIKAPNQFIEFFSAGASRRPVFTQSPSKANSDNESHRRRHFRMGYLDAGAV